MCLFVLQSEYSARPLDPATQTAKVLPESWNWRSLHPAQSFGKSTTPTQTEWGDLKNSYVAYCGPFWGYFVLLWPILGYFGKFWFPFWPVWDIFFVYCSLNTIPGP